MCEQWEIQKVVFILIYMVSSLGRMGSLNIVLVVVFGIVIYIVLGFFKIIIVSIQQEFFCFFRSFQDYVNLFVNVFKVLQYRVCFFCYVNVVDKCFWDGIYIVSVVIFLNEWKVFDQYLIVNFGKIKNLQFFGVGYNIGSCWLYICLGIEIIC